MQVACQSPYNAYQQVADIPVYEELVHRVELFFSKFFTVTGASKALLEKLCRDLEVNGIPFMGSITYTIEVDQSFFCSGISLATNLHANLIQLHYPIKDVSVVKDSTLPNLLLVTFLFG